MVLSFVADFVAQLIAEAILGVSVEARRARLAKRSIFRSGLRVVAGSQPGFGRAWKVRNWRVGADRLIHKGVELRVVGVVAGSRRRASFIESLDGWDETVIVRIRTASADLEWSTFKRFEDLAHRALVVPEVA